MRTKSYGIRFAKAELASHAGTTRIRTNFSQPPGTIYHRKSVLGFATGSHGIECRTRFVKGVSMPSKRNNHRPTAKLKLSAQPRLHQSANELQAYGTVNHLLPLELE